jgi:hypothetical protein
MLGRSAVLLQLKCRGDWFLVGHWFSNLLIRLKTPYRAKFIVLFFWPVGNCVTKKHAVNTRLALPAGNRTMQKREVVLQLSDGKMVGDWGHG